jgi:MYXO-CTERM domain-containing protein
MRTRLSLLLACVCTLSSSSAIAQRGVPQSGFPSWQERMVLVLANRARADPTGEMKACPESTIRPPLVWSYNLNRAARFHSRNYAAAMQAGGSSYFQHNSSCDLVSNLNSVYPPNGTCDGAIACACQNGMLLAPGAGTPTFTRIGMFGTQGSGENIAYGYSSPAQVHTGWMNSAGHCSNLLAGHGSLGVGWYNNHWTQNFGGGSATGTLIAGGHSPQFSGNTPIEFRVNYYDPAGGPPGAQINVDGACSTMALERGSPTNGTWLYTTTLSGTACRRYFFIFADAAGNTVYLPETGSYGVGGSLATCPDWEPGTPQGCGPLDKFPTVATPASATPDPVTGTSAQVSARGADDNGEAALTYTWSSSGPFGVTFSPNGTWAARDATATFGRVGTYEVTAAIRDASNQVVTSTVTVNVVQTPTGVWVTPATAAVATSATRQFAALATDQFGQPLAPMPAFAWTVSGGGTIDGVGLFTAGAMAGGPHTVTAATGAVSGTAHVIVGAGDPPIITQPAQANPNPVTGTTTQVSVLATDDGGDETILYAWSATGPGPVTFSASGTHAAKNATATFTRAGTYQLTATAQDAHGLSTSSTVQVAVVQMPGDLRVTPLQATVKPNAKAQFLARARDQFGVLIEPAPAYAWSVSGGGTIDDQGLFSAGAVSGGPHTVTATANTLGGTAQVVVTPQDPLPLVVALAQPQHGAQLRGLVKLAAQTNDSPRVARMRFTVDDVEIGDAQLAPYALTWDTTTHPDGERRLRAGAVDASGQTIWSPEVAVQLANSAQDTSPPLVTISSPQPGPLSGTVFVVADVTDDRGVASVTFSVDGTGFETLTQPPWQASFDASAFAAGEHLLTVTALDAAGNEGRAQVAFTTGRGGGGCGCAAGGPGGGGVLALAWLVAAMASRRRRSRAPGRP